MQTRTTLEQSKSSTSVSAIKRKQQPFFSPITVQPKLTIGTVDDPFEHEANAMADKVMRLTESSESQNSFFKPAVSSVQRKCAHCEEEEKLQRKSESGVSSCIEAPSVVHDVINSGGQTLDSGIRKFFEPRFGHDFSNVKIHSDSSAVKSAQRINALAYTTGDNIVFNQNQFSPGTDSGKKLLAHELTHVVQQKSDEIGYVQRMAACPVHLNDGAPTPPGWKNYFGSSSVFHCGFRTILEDRAPTPDDPMNECVYDHSGTLVDENHPYAGCRGTPDQYDSRTDPIKHSTIDSGGIVRAGAPALATSAWHAIVSPFEDAYNWMDRGIRNLYGVP